MHKNFVCYYFKTLLKGTQKKQSCFASPPVAVVGGGEREGLDYGLGKWQSKAVALMWVFSPSPCYWLAWYTACCTLPRPLWTSTVHLQVHGNQATSAGRSHCTLYVFFCGFVDLQWWGIIVPLGLIQCAFGYQCHLFVVPTAILPPKPIHLLLGIQK